MVREASRIVPRTWERGMNHGQRQTQIPRPSSSNGLANRTGVALCRTLANAFWNPAARSGRLDLLRPWLHGQCSNPNYGIVNGHQAIVCEGGRPLFIYLALAFALQLSHLGAEHLLHRTVACTSLGFTIPILNCKKHVARTPDVWGRNRPFLGP